MKIAVVQRPSFSGFGGATKANRRLMHELAKRRHDGRAFVGPPKVNPLSLADSVRNTVWSVDTEAPMGASEQQRT